jgi:hypothetical protein
MVVVREKSVAAAQEELDATGNKILHDLDKLHSQSVKNKKARLKASEDFRFEKEVQKDTAGPAGFAQRLLHTIVDNIQIHIVNVHIRYEHRPNSSASETQPSARDELGYPVSLGVVIAELTIASTDDNWETKFVKAEDIAQKSHKIIDLSNMFVYLNTRETKGNLEATPDSLRAIFQHLGPAVATPGTSPSTASSPDDAESIVSYASVAWVPPPDSLCDYVLHPVNANVRCILDYKRGAARPSSEPLVKIKALIPTVDVSLTQRQMHALIHIGANLTGTAARLKVFSSSVFDGADRAGTVTEKERYISLYKRTLSWSWEPILSPTEGQELENMESEILYEDLDNWRICALAELVAEMPSKGSASGEEGELTRRQKHTTGILAGVTSTVHKLRESASSAGSAIKGSAVSVTKKIGTKILPGKLSDKLGWTSKEEREAEESKTEEMKADDAAAAADAAADARELEELSAGQPEVVLDDETRESVRAEALAQSEVLFLPTGGKGRETMVAKLDLLLSTLSVRLVAEPDAGEPLATPTGSMPLETPTVDNIPTDAESMAWAPRAEQKNLFVLTLEKLRAGVIKRIDSMDINLELANLSFLDLCTPNTNYPLIISVDRDKEKGPRTMRAGTINSEGGVIGPSFASLVAHGSSKKADDSSVPSGPTAPFLKLKFEQSPLDESADAKLHVRLLPLEVIVHPVWLAALVTFVTPPPTIDMSPFSSKGAALKGLVQVTATETERALKEHKSMLMDVVVAGPRVVVLPDPAVARSNPQGMLLLELKEVTVKSRVQQKKTLEEIQSLLDKYHQMHLADEAARSRSTTSSSSSSSGAVSAPIVIEGPGDTGRTLEALVAEDEEDLRNFYDTLLISVHGVTLSLIPNYVSYKSVWTSGSASAGQLRTPILLPFDIENLAIDQCVAPSLTFLPSQRIRGALPIIALQVGSSVLRVLADPAFFLPFMELPEKLAAVKQQQEKLAVAKGQTTRAALAAMAAAGDAKSGGEAGGAVSDAAKPALLSQSTLDPDVAAEKEELEANIEAHRAAAVAQSNPPAGPAMSTSDAIEAAGFQLQNPMDGVADANKAQSARKTGEPMEGRKLGFKDILVSTGSEKVARLVLMESIAKLDSASGEASDECISSKELLKREITLEQFEDWYAKKKQVLKLNKNMLLNVTIQGVKISLLTEDKEASKADEYLSLASSAATQYKPALEIDIVAISLFLQGRAFDKVIGLELGGIQIRECLGTGADAAALPLLRTVQMKTKVSSITPGRQSALSPASPTKSELPFLFLTLSTLSPESPDYSTHPIGTEIDIALGEIELNVDPLSLDRLGVWALKSLLPREVRNKALKAMKEKGKQKGKQEEQKKESEAEISAEVDAPKPLSAEKSLLVSRTLGQLENGVNSAIQTQLALLFSGVTINIITRTRAFATVAVLDITAKLVQKVNSLELEAGVNQLWLLDTSNQPIVAQQAKAATTPAPPLPAILWVRQAVTETGQPKGRMPLLTAPISARLGDVPLPIIKAKQEKGEMPRAPPATQEPGRAAPFLHVHLHQHDLSQKKAGIGGGYDQSVVAELLGLRLRIAPSFAIHLLPLMDTCMNLEILKLLKDEQARTEAEKTPAEKAQEKEEKEQAERKAAEESEEKLSPLAAVPSPARIQALIDDIQIEIPLQEISLGLASSASAVAARAASGSPSATQGGSSGSEEETSIPDSRSLVLRVEDLTLRNALEDHTGALLGAEGASASGAAAGKGKQSSSSRRKRSSGSKSLPTAETIEARIGAVRVLTTMPSLVPLIDPATGGIKEDSWVSRARIGAAEEGGLAASSPSSAAAVQCRRSIHGSGAARLKLVPLLSLSGSVFTLRKSLRALGSLDDVATDLSVDLELGCLDARVSHAQFVFMMRLVEKLGALAEQVGKLQKSMQNASPSVEDRGTQNWPASAATPTSNSTMPALPDSATSSHPSAFPAELAEGQKLVEEARERRPAGGSGEKLLVRTPGGTIATKDSGEAEKVLKQRMKSLSLIREEHSPADEKVQKNGIHPAPARSEPTVSPVPSASPVSQTHGQQQDPLQAALQKSPFSLIKLSLHLTRLSVELLNSGNGEALTAGTDISMDPSASSESTSGSDVSSSLVFVLLQDLAFATKLDREGDGSATVSLTLGNLSVIDTTPEGLYRRVKPRSEELWSSFTETDSDSEFSTMESSSRAGLGVGSKVHLIPAYRNIVSFGAGAEDSLDRAEKERQSIRELLVSQLRAQARKSLHQADAAKERKQLWDAQPKIKRLAVSRASSVVSSDSSAYVSFNTTSSRTDLPLIFKIKRSGPEEQHAIEAVLELHNLQVLLSPALMQLPEFFKLPQDMEKKNADRAAKQAKDEADHLAQQRAQLALAKESSERDDTTEEQHPIGALATEAELAACAPSTDASLMADSLITGQVSLDPSLAFSKPDAAPRNPASQLPPISVRVRMVNPAILLVADPFSTHTRGLVVSWGIEAKLSAEAGLKNLEAALGLNNFAVVESAFEVNEAGSQNVMKFSRAPENMQRPIIAPFSLRVGAKGGPSALFRDGGFSKNLEVEAVLTRIDITAGFRIYQLINTALENLTPSSKKLKETRDARMVERYGEDWESRSNPRVIRADLVDNGVTATEKKVEPVPQDPLGPLIASLPVPQLDFSEINVVLKSAGIHISLLNDAWATRLPFLRLQVGNLGARVHMFGGGGGLLATLELRAELYNHRLLDWEPVLEPWGAQLAVTQCQVTHTPAAPLLMASTEELASSAHAPSVAAASSAGTAGASSSASQAAPAPPITSLAAPLAPITSVSFTSKTPLNLNISAALLEDLADTFKELQRLTRATQRDHPNSKQLWKTIETAPRYKVENHTDLEMKVFRIDLGQIEARELATAAGMDAGVELPAEVMSILPFSNGSFDFNDEVSIPVRAVRVQLISAHGSLPSLTIPTAREASSKHVLRPLDGSGAMVVVVDVEWSGGVRVINIHGSFAVANQTNVPVLVSGDNYLERALNPGEKVWLPLLVAPRMHTIRVRPCTTDVRRAFQMKQMEELGLPFEQTSELVTGVQGEFDWSDEIVLSAPTANTKQRSTLVDHFSCAPLTGSSSGSILVHRGGSALAHPGERFHFTCFHAGYDVRDEKQTEGTQGNVNLKRETDFERAYHASVFCIRTPVTLENVLACDAKIRILNGDKLSDDKDTTGSLDSAVVASELSLRCGRTFPLHGATTAKDTYISLLLPALDAGWTKPIKLPLSRSVSEVQVELAHLVGNNGGVLPICVETKQNQGSLRVVLYTQYWMWDLTSLSLQITPDKKLVLPQRAAALDSSAASTSSTSLSSSSGTAVSKDLSAHLESISLPDKHSATMFSYDTTKSSKGRLWVRCGRHPRSCGFELSGPSTSDPTDSAITWSEWSEKVSVDAPDNQNAISIPMSSLKSTGSYEIVADVQAGAGLFRRTKMVKFLPRYIVANTLPCPVRIRQAGLDEKDAIVLNKGQQIIWHWPRAVEKDRAWLTVQRILPRKQESEEELDPSIADAGATEDWHWSGYFELDCVGDTNICVRNRDNPDKLWYLHIDTRTSSNGLTFVVLDQYPTATLPDRSRLKVVLPYCIANRSTNEWLRVRQVLDGNKYGDVSCHASAPATGTKKLLQRSSKESSDEKDIGQGFEWQYIAPETDLPFCWEEPLFEPRAIEVQVAVFEGTDANGKPLIKKWITPGQTNELMQLLGQGSGLDALSLEDFEGDHAYVDYTHIDRKASSLVLPSSLPPLCADRKMKYPNRARLYYFREQDGPTNFLVFSDTPSDAWKKAQIRMRRNMTAAEKEEDKKRVKSLNASGSSIKKAKSEEEKEHVVTEGEKREQLSRRSSSSSSHRDAEDSKGHVLNPETALGEHTAEQAGALTAKHEVDAQTRAVGHGHLVQEPVLNVGPAGYSGRTIPAGASRTNLPFELNLRTFREKVSELRVRIHAAKSLREKDKKVFCKVLLGQHVRQTETLKINSHDNEPVQWNQELVFRGSDIGPTQTLSERQQKWHGWKPAHAFPGSMDRTAALRSCLPPQCVSPLIPSLFVPGNLLKITC